MINTSADSLEEFKKPTSQQSEAMTLYANLLEEAKIRINSVEQALAGTIPLPGPFLREYCFLQLRMLCELIAIGCFVVHGDINKSGIGKIKKTWSAEDIINSLTDIHPAFYPIPHLQEKTPTGFNLTALSDGYLTKDDLITLVHISGSHLHRGSVKKILKGPQPIQFNFPDVLGWLQKIGKLLSLHMIPLFQEGTLILVVLRNMQDNQRVQIAFASKPFPKNEQVANAKKGAGGNDR
jgi:hypothetical protein